jgi:hypothetical protein
MKETGNVTGVTRIDENRYLSPYQISVAVIFIGTLPEVGVEISFKFHPIELLLTFSTP